MGRKVRRRELREVEQKAASDRDFRRIARRKGWYQDANGQWRVRSLDSWSSGW